MDEKHNIDYCKLENNRAICNHISKVLDKNTAAISFVSPIVRTQISPSQRILPSIHIPEEFGIEDAITEIKKDKNINRLYLLINSFGGGATSSFKIARMIRDNFDDITVFIPHMAASGGTMIALTGDRIIMGGMSSLTPTDVQMHINNGYYSVNTYIRAFAHFTNIFSRYSEDDAPYTYKAMAAKFNPLEFQDCVDSRNFSRIYTKSILEHKKSSMSDRADKICEKLLSGFPQHEYAITIEKAKEIIGDDIVFDFKENGKYINTWYQMREWLRQYITHESPIHFIRYIVPNISEDENNGKTRLRERNFVRGI